MVQRRLDRKASILRAAAEVFATVGYSNATPADIAARAGLPPGSLHYHITSKEQLLYEVLSEGMDNLQDRLTELVNSPRPAPDRLYTYIFETIIANCERRNSG